MLFQHGVLEAIKSNFNNNLKWMKPFENQWHQNLQYQSTCIFVVFVRQRSVGDSAERA